MEMKSKAQRSLSRKKAALKKMYSGVAILAGYNESYEFTDLIVEAKELFRKYGLDELYSQKSGSLVKLSDYKNRKEKL